MTRKTPFRRKGKYFRKAPLMDPALKGLPIEDARQLAHERHEAKLAAKQARRAETVHVEWTPPRSR